HQRVRQRETEVPSSLTSDRPDSLIGWGAAYHLTPSPCRLAFSFCAERNEIGRSDVELLTGQRSNCYLDQSPGSCRGCRTCRAANAIFELANRIGAPPHARACRALIITHGVSLRSQVREAAALPRSRQQPACSPNMIPTMLAPSTSAQVFAADLSLRY